MAALGAYREWLLDTYIEGGKFSSYLKLKVSKGELPPSVAQLAIATMYRLRLKARKVSLMFARTALCAAFLLPVAGLANVAAHDVVLASHGLNIAWNGIPISGINALEEACRKEAKMVVRSKFTAVFDLSTPNAQMKRILNVLHRGCGASSVLATFSYSEPPQLGR